mgnify:CR=1 FL=1
MNFDMLEHLERAISGGWSDGRWVMFMDQNSQAHLYGDFEPDALLYVQSFGPVPAVLRTNCRNTREIVYNTRALTGADTGVAAAGAGPQVEFVPVGDGEAETAALEAHLRRLRDQEVSAGHVTIVSMRGDWETSAARGLRAARTGGLRFLDDQLAARWPVDELTWSSAVDMKGLENRFVCVIDIDALESYNTTFGRAAGDSSIRRVAHCLSGCLRRASDVTARLEGGSFVVAAQSGEQRLAACIGSFAGGNSPA